MRATLLALKVTAVWPAVAGEPGEPKWLGSQPRNVIAGGTMNIAGMPPNIKGCL